MTTTASERLGAKIGLVAGELGRAATDAFTGDPVLPVYTEWLIATHQVIRATVPLVEAAHRRSTALAASDPVAALLLGHFEREISQERAHDDLLLEDLAVLGVPAEQVWARQPSPAVAALVGSQYYWVLHHHPVSLLGYAAIAEGHAPTQTFVDELAGRTGIGPSAVRALRLHAAADAAHRAQLDEVLDALPLTAAHEAAIGTAALAAAGGWIEVLRVLRRTPGS